MDSKDIIDSENEENEDMVEKLETAMDTMDYITKIQTRLDKLNSKIFSIDNLMNELKDRKKRLNYRVNKMECLQKLAITNFN